MVCSRQASLTRRTAPIASALVVLAGLTLPGAGARSGAGARQGGRRVRAPGLRHLPLDAAVVALPRPVAGSTSVRPTSAAARPTSRSPRRRRARRIYAAYATSGVWKTDDDGATWQSIFDNQPSTSIGDIAVAPSNPDIVWVGTGESNLFRASMPGVGVFKSTDAGRTFQHGGLTDTQTIARIVVHPDQPRHRLRRRERARLDRQRDARRVQDDRRRPHLGEGALPKPADRRHRSGDGSGGSRTRSTRRRGSACGASGATRGSSPATSETGIWKTTDGGTDLGRVEPGPAGAAVPRPHRPRRVARRTRTCCTRSSTTTRKAGRRARASATPTAGRSWRAGSRRPRSTAPTTRARTWRKVSESNDFMTAALGHLRLGVRPDPRRSRPTRTRSTRSASSLNVSRDAGKTFTPLRGMHGDHHGLWIDPKNPSVLYNANDGGFYRSADAGKTWTFAVSAGGAQFYNVAARHQHAGVGVRLDPGHRQPARPASICRQGRDRIPAVEWSDAPGGEGSHQAIDPANPNIVYSHGFYGNFTREDLAVRAGRRRRPAQPAGPRRAPGRDGHPPAAGRRRGAARAVDGADHRVAARPGDDLRRLSVRARSPDRGDAWQPISHDLTRERSVADAAQELERDSLPDDRRRWPNRRGRKGLLYAGTDDGRLHVTRDGGTTWTELTAQRCRPASGSRAWCRRSTTTGTVYVTQRGREDDDFGVYVYKSTDFGKTFTSIAAQHPGRLRERHSRGPDRPQRAVSRHRLRRLRVERRRPAVARARRQPAVGAGVRPAVSPARSA